MPAGQSGGHHELDRRLLPPQVLAGVDRELDGYRSAAQTFGDLEAILDRVEALLLGGHHVNLTHHRVKRRAVHPLIRDVFPDVYGRINLKRLWVGERSGPGRGALTAAGARAQEVSGA